MNKTFKTEAELERQLVEELNNNGYERIHLKSIDDVYANLRIQLSKLNNCEIDEENFKKINAYLQGGNVFEKAKKLRDRFEIEIDGRSKNIIFLNSKDWCKNIFQVTNQIEVVGKRNNRYDVTILFNGIPMVQIELKRPGIDVKESFNQCLRYKHESHQYSIFDYTQMFIISNGNVTRYFANNNKMNEDDFKQVIEYANSDNKKINQISDFRFNFLERCQLSKLITQYLILVDGDGRNNGKLILMRPYQVHAVEKILNKVDDQVGNGYIWHTTGSGKTLTSFKAAQLVAERSHVDKVLFIVDRTDLDAQTNTEFKKFGGNLSFEDIVKEYKSTKEVMDDLKSTQKIMVTTIQKLDNAIKYFKDDEELRNKHVVLIFDECHRSQKGDMHRRINNYFNNLQKFGFTGTPIFAENAADFITTSQIFGKENHIVKPGEQDPYCLHKYILPNAIDDNKVLGFSVEYYNPFKQKEFEDKEIKSIDKQEVYDSIEYQQHIVESIFKNFNKNTHYKTFNAMFATDGIKNAVNYYQLFKEYNEKLEEKDRLIVGCIYSWNPNDAQNSERNSRDDLDMIMQDYNKIFKEKHSTDNFNHYRVDIMKKIKNKEIDIIIVSDMLLTGFDAPSLNTLYVDKNLQYHGLIQAFSRTNRLNGAKKDYGNIICFRPIQERVHKAIKLFSDGAPITTVQKRPYQEYLINLDAAWFKLVEIFREPEIVLNLTDPEERKDFILVFKEVNRNYRFMQSFTSYVASDLPFTEEEFFSFKDAYVELTRPDNIEKESILNDIDFELELIAVDRIDYTFIINLLKEMKENHEITVEDIEKRLSVVEMTKSKRELIHKFISYYLEQRPHGDMEDIFESFNQDYKNVEINKLIKEEQLDNKFIEYIANYEYDPTILKEPEIPKYYMVKPSILDRTKKALRIKERVTNIFHNISY